MLRCYITDRRMFGGSIDALIANIERQIAAGVDWIQIREKDLSGRELALLARRAVELAGNSRNGTRILINSRLDIALASGAHGIHLPSASPPASAFRPFARDLRIGVSCHNREELAAAEAEGADYAVLGPVFAPRSKAMEGPWLGLKKFEELVRDTRIPVLALGGITHENSQACIEAGAAGVAGISLFQQEE
ncbi:MAG TPA: thiamine phosphate synthase [Bryobacteraceae bacterium]|jgi:thiamine-phosphate pyrophosphorylase